jgi:hypothetical protein
LARIDLETIEAINGFFEAFEQDMILKGGNLPPPLTNIALDVQYAQEQRRAGRAEGVKEARKEFLETVKRLKSNLAKER